MTTFTNQALLPFTTYGIPSGNYDGSTPDFIGDAIPAANFYGGQGSAQTAIITSTGFVGIMTIEATLNDLTQQALWFDVATYGNGIDPYTEVQALNIIGNFVWLRAKVTQFVAGTINSANVVY
jgi:hypothetical protein